MLRGPLRTFAAAIRACYQPDKLYLGRLKLVLVDDPRLDHAANQRIQQLTVKGWKQWAPNLTYTHCAGNHLTVLKAPHVRDLAGALESELSRSWMMAGQPRA
jgi:arthrofactin-type cyclic lipopeptide synthetase C